MSYPAAKALPRVGVLALAESFLIRSGGDCESLVVGGGGGGGGALSEGMVAVILGRLASGDVGWEGGSWVGFSVVEEEGGGVVGMVFGER